MILVELVELRTCLVLSLSSLGSNPVTQPDQPDQIRLEAAARLLSAGLQRSQAPPLIAVPLIVVPSCGCGSTRPPRVVFLPPPPHRQRTEGDLVVVLVARFVVVVRGFLFQMYAARELTCAPLASRAGGHA